MAFLKFLFKTLFYLFLLILLFSLCILGLSVWIAPKLAPKFIDTWMEGKTGFSTSIQKMELNFFPHTINLENITLINPPYYQNKNFMQIKQLLIQAPISSIWKTQKTFDSIHINIDKLTLVRTPENSINLLEFANSFRKHSLYLPQNQNIDSPDNPDLPPNESTQPQSKYLIKKLIIQLSSINTIGFTNADESQTFTVDYYREFTDVTDIEDVAKQTIVDLANHSINNLAQDLGPIAEKIVSPKIKKKIRKAIEKTFSSLKNSETQL